MENKTYDKKLAIAAQEKLCEDEKYPHFAPINGICYDCNSNIYVEQKHEHGKYKWSTGVSVESAGKALITGCPHCSHSYCD